MDTFSKLKSFFKCWKICLGHETWDSTKWHKQILKKSILTKGKAYKVSYLQSSPGITYQPFSYIIYHAIPKLPILPPWAFDWSFAQHNGLRIIWPKMRNAQSGIFMSKFWSVLQAKEFHNSFHIQHVQRIAPILNVCWGIWEPFKRPVKCGISGMRNFNEQTTVKQLSET